MSRDFYSYTSLGKLQGKQAWIMWSELFKS